MHSELQKAYIKCAKGITITIYLITYNCMQLHDVDTKIFEIRII